MEDDVAKASSFIGKLVNFPINDSRVVATVKSVRNIGTMVLVDFVENNISVNYLICKLQVVEGEQK